MIALVTGARGQLGASVVAGLSETHEVVALDRTRLDLTDQTAVFDVVENRRPDVIINCAAYNDVDGSEDDAETAFAVNALAVRSLARSAIQVDATLVHYSTDFVFDGRATQPYSEESAPNPQSVYAMSKLVGEWFASDARAYVLRVESLFGGGDRPSFHGSLDRMAQSMLDGEAVHAFADRIVSPSYVHDVVDATAAVLTRRPAAGVYHCVGSGQATWLEVARELARHFERPAEIRPIQVADRSHKAARPVYCALSNAKLSRAGIAMPPWQDAVRRYAESLKSPGDSRLPG